MSAGAASVAANGSAFYPCAMPSWPLQPCRSDAAGPAKGWRGHASNTPNRHLHE
jgi:hypothetical protein